MERLDPRVRFVWAIGAIARALVVGVVATGIVVFLTDRSIWIGFGVGAVVLALGLGHALLRYRIWRFEVQDDALYLERGVLTRVRTVVPYVRIQHVDTQRGPVDRIAGIGSVVVYTAGSRGADVAIPGLDPERATALQHRLRSLVGESESEDAV
ncbi:putative membrane protein YdbS, contains bPH2 (bacterial pleckstrin homology) domain [Halanaeroarchaeum sp. HSR-CO]|uniref:PH domain-containing protein n=1 Tax=Halanaeroarchaeum sp. HSR-CO TaxID=2866382 RepID=UPI00217DBE1F|nr:PH domain-containing protein [Halanaeroarchaeum sp. HSR-CO]UWG47875.1 putative membrane protein YdbS, contains bPH2 (bacterial pleckstrin homology) domain [Halanaeroarchaeum sp. HSR-CO]